jgi:hypothetical protein
MSTRNEISTQNDVIPFNITIENPTCFCCTWAHQSGYDNDYTIIVWDWETKTAVGSTKALNKTEVCVCYLPVLEFEALIAV